MKIVYEINEAFFLNLCNGPTQGYTLQLTRLGIGVIDNLISCNVIVAWKCYLGKKKKENYCLRFSKITYSG